MQMPLDPDVADTAPTEIARAPTHDLGFSDDGNVAKIGDQPVERIQLDITHVASPLAPVRKQSRPIARQSRNTAGRYRGWPPCSNPARSWRRSLPAADSRSHGNSHPAACTARTDRRSRRRTATWAQRG